MVYLHLYLYFYDPLWIISHNLFHAPFILLALGVVGWLGIQNSQPWSTYLLWFVLGATLHSLIDIATHHNDVRLRFFPFDGTYLGPSPIIYWDPA